MTLLTSRVLNESSKVLSFKTHDDLSPITSPSFPQPAAVVQRGSGGEEAGGGRRQQQGREQAYAKDFVHARSNFEHVDPKDQAQGGAGHRGSMHAHKFY